MVSEIENDSVPFFGVQVVGLVTENHNMVDIITRSRGKNLQSQ